MFLLLLFFQIPSPFLLVALHSSLSFYFLFTHFLSPFLIFAFYRTSAPPGSSYSPHCPCSSLFPRSSPSLLRTSEACVHTLILIGRSLFFPQQIRDDLTFRRSDVRVRPPPVISVIPRLNLSDSPVTSITTHSVRGERASERRREKKNRSAERGRGRRGWVKPPDYNNCQLT